MKQPERTLEEQRIEFSNGKFLATPLAGLIAWLIVGISGWIAPAKTTVWVLFIATGCIVYLGMFISKFTGENFLDKTKPKNEFDKLFFFTVAVGEQHAIRFIGFGLVDGNPDGLARNQQFVDQRLAETC